MSLDVVISFGELRALPYLYITVTFCESQETDRPIKVHLFSLFVHFGSRYKTGTAFEGLCVGDVLAIGQIESTKQELQFVWVQISGVFWDADGLLSQVCFVAFENPNLSW